MKGLSVLRSIAPIAILLIALSLLGCRTTKDESDLAASFLITLEDFPAEWQVDSEDETDSEAAEDDSSSPFDACPYLATDGLRGIADSPTFVGNGGFFRVSQTVAVFNSAENAVSSYESFPGTLDCRVELINAGSADSAEAKFSEAATETVDFVSLGDASHYYRLLFSLSGQVTGEDALPIPVMIDVVMVVEDRFWFMIQTQSILFPIEFAEPELLATLARKTVDRMTGAVPAAAAESLSGTRGQGCRPGVTLDVTLAQLDASAEELAELKQQLARLEMDASGPCELTRFVPLRTPLLSDLLGLP
jgi:hypothetical protein